MSKDGFKNKRSVLLPNFNVAQFLLVDVQDYYMFRKFGGRSPKKSNKSEIGIQQKDQNVNTTR
jgi:hypothetical protein